MKANKKTKAKSQRATSPKALRMAAQKTAKGIATEAPKNIEALAQDIRTRLEDADKEATLNNYEVGQMVNEAVDNPATYGLAADASVVQLIAEKVGYQKDTIYNAAKVAKAWPRKDFTAWRNRKGLAGCVLQFAHFVEAVKLREPGKRDEMLEQALAEGLSTRQLRQLCKKPKGEGGTPARRVSVPRLLESIIKLGEKCRDILCQVPEALVGFDGKGVADPAGLVERAQETQHRLHEICLENAKTLAATFETLRQASVGQPAPSVGATVVQLPILGVSNAEPVNQASAGGAE